MMDKRFRQNLHLMGRWMCVVAILLIQVLSLVVSSCSSIDCPVENIVSVQYEIRDKAGAALPLTDSLSIVTKRLDGQNVDITALLNSENVILNKLIGKSAFSLPISYSHPEDILLFCFTNSERTLVDTVWIKKEDIPHFESVDCSAAFFHELTNVRHTNNAIDSLVLINTSVTYDVSTVHFYLYPKTGN